MEMIECDIKKPRNIKFHKKTFALFNLVFSNQEHYQNVDDLRHDLTVAAGYYLERINLQGETIRVAKSISFAKMDEHDFSEYYDSIIAQIVLHFHFDKQGIIDNVSQYF